MQRPMCTVRMQYPQSMRMQSTQHTANTALACAVVLSVFAAACGAAGLAAEGTAALQRLDRFDSSHNAATAAPLLRRSSSMSAAAMDTTGASGPITQCFLTGFVPLLDGSSQDILLYFHLRLLIHEGILYVKGRMRSQHMTRTDWPCLANDCNPNKYNFTLRSTASWTKHYFIHRTHFWPTESVLSQHVLDPDDALYGEFEFMVGGFSKHCKVIAERITRPSQIPLLQSPDKVPQNREAALARPVHMISSPMMWHSSEEMLNILEPYIAHNRLMGVTRMVQYFLEGSAQFVQQPRAQALIASGDLEAILFDTWPIENYDRNTAHDKASKDQYEWQQDFYNHALMRYWLEDVYLIIADVDEYIVTSKPGMTLPQALLDCPQSGNSLPPGTPIASHVLTRRNAHCVGCRRHEGDLHSWQDATYTNGQPTILLYGMTYQPDNARKTIVYPTFIRGLRTHDGQPVAGAKESWHFSNGSHDVVDGEKCVVFMHMGNMHRNRDRNPDWSFIVSQLNLAVSEASWWWPYLPLQPVWNRGLPSQGREGGRKMR